MNEFVRCPKCKSVDWVRKGKTIDKKYQRLRCKKCKKNWTVESFLVNRQKPLPKIENRIIEHPDGTFSVNKLSIIDHGRTPDILNLEFITEKVGSYGEIIELASSLAEAVNPNPIKLEKHVPQSMVRQLELLFPKRVSKEIESMIETMCKEITTWNK